MTHQKDSVRQFYQAICNGTEQTTLGNILSKDFVLKGSLAQTASGKTNFPNYMEFVRNALSNYQCEITDIVEEGNKVYARINYSGIHDGELFGYAATHAAIKWEGIAAFTFVDEKIQELWVMGDVLSVMKQIARYVG